MLAEMAREVAAARAVTRVAAAAKDRGEPIAEVSSIAKWTASDAAMRVATDAVQLFGASGYSRETGVERLMRDAKGAQIYEGTNQIHRLIVADEVLRNLVLTAPTAGPAIGGSGLRGLDCRSGGAAATIARAQTVTRAKDRRRCHASPPLDPSDRWGGPPAACHDGLRGRERRFRAVRIRSPTTGAVDLASPPEVVRGSPQEASRGARQHGPRDRSTARAARCRIWRIR